MNMLSILAASQLAITSTSAETTIPYKLIITWYQSGIVSVDYPNKQRCEQAAKDVYNRMSKRAKEIGLPPESGDIAFCISG